MEFVEEESRPRFLFHSRSSPPSSSPPPETLKPNTLHLLACFASAALLLSLVFTPLLSSSEILTFLLVWISLSLLIAPFAPSSLTGGDPIVGRGEPLPPPPSPPSTSDSDPPPSRRPRSRRPENNNPQIQTPAIVPRSQDPTPAAPKSQSQQQQQQGESEWTDGDFEILKKQISKHPVGEPQRWEKIAEAFSGRHRLDTVIKMGKSMSERRQPPDAKDSFQQFLKQRKPVDKRVEEEVRESSRWSSSEDIALLNALKAFPKEVSMRWEKVAAAVPGKTKGECAKRVAELKKDFRSSKGTES